jgi:glycosyltransferase involved in cell wall biosynthesis
MHILLIHQAFAALNEPGGTRHHELARFLCARGQRVTVIASPISYLTGSQQAAESDKLDPADDTNGDLTILRTYTYPALHRSFFHRVISFVSFMLSSFVAGLRVPAPDLVWGTSPPIFQAGTAWAVARLRGIPFVLEIRDLWPAFAVGVGVLRNPLLIRLAEAFERFLYRHADRVVINSPGFSEHVRQGGARQVELVPNGADTRMFDPLAKGEGFRRRHNLEGKFVLLYAGAHGLSNDLDILLQAASRLQDLPQVVLVLLGDGKEKPRLMEQASQMQLTNVRFLDPLPKVAMPEALAAADACVAILKPIPEYKTVYPNKVFDYLAAGRPVILAIDGVIREVVEQARAGLCVPPGDSQALAAAVRQLAQQPEVGRQMGLHGRAYVQEHFDRQVVALRLETILRDTADEYAP